MFQALSGQLKSTPCLVEVVTGFTGEDAEFIDENCNWTAAETWASWWMRPDNILCIMANEDTNAVERKNRDSKDAHPVTIHQANLYKSYVASFLTQTGQVERLLSCANNRG